MALDIQHQLLERIKSSPFFSLQLEEPADVTNGALLLVFVITGTAVCMLLPTRATAQECFTENDLDWQNCVGVYSNGAASRTCRHHSFIRQILDRAPEAKRTHCFLHCESPAAAATEMSPEFHEVMDVSVKTLNFTKNNAVNSRCFAKLCEDMEADHVQLLYRSEVRWLSRGLVLKHLFELRNEVFSYAEKISSCTLLCQFKAFLPL